MVDVFEISAVVAAMGLLVGVAYYIIEIRSTEKTRETDLVMRLYYKFSSNQFQNAWMKFRNRAKKLETIDDFFDFDEKTGIREVHQVCLFFEAIGLLLYRKNVDKAMIKDLFGGEIERAWQNAKPAVIKAREQLNDLTVYSHFEYLYQEIKEKQQ